MLQALGWKVAVVWECEISTSDALAAGVQKLVREFLDADAG